MLTKKLLKYKISGGKIYPQFVEPSKTDLLSTGTQFLRIFKKSIGLNRAQLTEECKTIIESQADLIFARGIEKLLLDRTKFDSSPEELSTKLYSDLPEYQNILSFNSLSPERLLHRYNCAQVQGLLIYSEKINITLRNPSPEKSRQLFKYLRFHQLLAKIQSNNTNLLIEVDGPLSLFDQTRKYGLNLATFFPGILHQDNWAVTAEVQIKGNRTHVLSIDHNSPLRPYSHRFHSYVPNELLMFQTLFEERVREWTITPAKGLLHLNNEHHCFPDFMLAHTSGRKIAMELFHKWHESHLIARLQSLELTHKPPLLIGISSRLTKKREILSVLEASKYYSKFGFQFFREMPTINVVEKLLQSLP